MVKRCSTPFSIVNQVILLLLVLSLIAVVSMSMATWRAESIQGHAHAINKTGSLRMQSYRLLTMVPFNHESRSYLDEFEQEQDSKVLTDIVTREQLTPQLDEIKRDWHQQLRPQLERAQNAKQATEQVIQFVHQLDNLVSAIDHKTEQSLLAIKQQQVIFIVLTLLVLGIAVYYLRSRFLTPWRKLLSMSESVGKGDFSQRYNIIRNDEMGVMGQTLNAMSDELCQMYSCLESRVKEKTDELQQKNITLSFLYHTSQQLHTSEPLCSRLMSVLNQLQNITPLYNLQIRLYENSDINHFHLLTISETYRPAYCQQKACHACLSPKEISHQPRQTLSWRLEDQHGQYGLILAEQPISQSLTNEHTRLINTLVEQITSTLTLERQAHNHQQLMLMEERSAIARELHDSIAQSLSCLKIQVSCMQMESSQLPENSLKRLGEMREELNIAYRQLRELLTTFRLQLSEAGLHAALQNTVQEFSDKLGFPVAFNYQLPPHYISSHQAIHLVQIAREALNNVYKHANASWVSLSVESQQGEVILVVSDNGCGLPEDSARANHYGLIIMRDRALNLCGKFDIYNRPAGGTEVNVKFHPPLITNDPKEL